MAIDFSDLGAVPVSEQSGGGIDFSDLGGVPINKPQMGGKPPIGFVANEVMKMAPWNKASQALKDVAGTAAEKMGSMGVPPKVAASVALPLAIAPELLAAGTSLAGLEGETPLAQAITNTPRDLSPRYAALNEAAGISKDLPQATGRVAKFPNLAGQPSKVPPSFAPAISPTSYPKDTNSFLNFARMRLESLGERLQPQELNDYKSMMNTAMNDGTLTPGTDQFAVATQLKKQATDLLNKAVPGRVELDQIYALSKKLRVAPEVAKKLWNYLGPKMRWGLIDVP